MRCKKHLTDFSSRVGVCASCLRERLSAIIATQARAQAQEDRRKYDAQNLPPPPHVAFPRSVSPYVAGNLTHQSDHLHRSLKDQLFFSTPQIGPNCGVFTGDLNAKQQKKSKLSLFSRLFRFKSRNPDPDLDRRVSDSNSRSSFTAASSSPSWFSSMLLGHRQKQSRLCSLNEPTVRFARGMSPARVSDYGSEAEWYESSGYESESSQSWWHTPGRAAPPSQRGGRRSQSRNLSGMKFCLSPLVRASPNRHWNHKGVLPEAVFSGDIRVPARTHVSPAASLCVSRSRKLADFGRFNHNL
ncbi:uncharacterized protein LOC130781482 [Actinidia eriantha]|uniref:uncharacterized protein LOC130781482 n=1 Tax=Actinidia eriantha TaxID=165200 RepID=UPI00258EBE48|nr:uncharacterized protein LOC130781482 [Actinidia eriantha]